MLTGDFPWLANLLYFAALIFALIGTPVFTRICSALALGLGALSFRVHQWWFNEGSGTPIEKLGPAFYCWMASFLLLLLLSFFARKPSAPVQNHGEAPKA